MLIMAAGAVGPDVRLDASKIGNAITAIGTDQYGQACLDVFQKAFDVDHWAAYAHYEDHQVERISSASRQHSDTVEDAVKIYLSRFKGVDPSLNFVPRHVLDSGCIVRLEVSDIPDSWYKQCFAITRVQERLSFYHRQDGLLHQLNIYRSSRQSSYSEDEIVHYIQIARLMIPMVAKHRTLCRDRNNPPPRLGVVEIEQILDKLPIKLSLRERQVCARGTIGMTIEGTALDLEIKRTSVITYRQRAYLKLGVSCQNELTAILHNYRPH